MLRKKNKYARPRKPFESARIAEENNLLKQYGLKNKKEVWKTVAKVNYYRGRAKALARSPIEEQEVLFNKLKALGIKADNISDVLGLKVEDFLNRRLTTIVANKKLASTVKAARQMTVHKKITIDGKVVNSPSYLVEVSEEKHIGIKQRKTKAVAVKATEVNSEDGEQSEE